MKAILICFKNSQMLEHLPHSSDSLNSPQLAATLPTGVLQLCFKQAGGNHYVLIYFPMAVQPTLSLVLLCIEVS
jgi:hypothetical protein